MAVTKSTCWKQHKHSFLEMCHNLQELETVDKSDREGGGEKGIE